MAREMGNDGIASRRRQSELMTPGNYVVKMTTSARRRREGNETARKLVQIVICLWQGESVYVCSGIGVSLAIVAGGVKRSKPRRSFLMREIEEITIVVNG